MTFEEYESMRNSFVCDSFDNEVWLPVVGLEGYYEVSSLGRFRASCDIIWSVSSRFGKKGQTKHKKGDIIPQYVDYDYIMVCLYDPRVRSNNNRFSCIQSHILISEAFCGFRCNYQFVTDHIDGNKHNNQASNLQIITQQQNSQKSYDNDESNRWSKRKSAVIRDDGTMYVNIKEACADTGCSDAALISAITTGGVCAGFHWKYADKEKQASIESARPKKRTKHVTNTGYRVYCEEYGEIRTGAEWAREFNCVSDTIYRAIDYSNGYSKFLDKHFRLADDRAYK